MVDFDKLKAGLDSSYQSNDKAEKTLKKQGLTLDKSLSGERAKVYTDADGKPHISYRGTENKNDVLTDVKAFLGMNNNKRIRHSKKVAREVESKYGTPATAVGHSLGGFLAEKSGVHGEIITYNKLATGRSKKNDKQIDIRDQKDLASVLTQNRKSNITLQSKSKNPLVIHSTKGLKTSNIIQPIGLMKSSVIIKTKKKK